MKMYAVCHFALSAIQKGIQAQHAITELAQYYTSGNYTTNLAALYDEWAAYHKTSVYLDGGNSSSLLALIDNLSSVKTIAYASFDEDQDTLEGITTAVALLADDEMCDKIEAFRENRADARVIIMLYETGLPPAAVLSDETVDRLSPQELTAYDVICAKIALMNLAS